MYSACSMFSSIAVWWSSDCVHSHIQHFLASSKNSRQPNFPLDSMSGPWMQELADVEDVATEAAFQAAQMGDQAPPVSKTAPPALQEPMAVPSSVDDTPTEPATSPSQGGLTLKSKNGQWNFNFQHEKLVLVQNQKSIHVHMWWMMVNGQKKSMQLTSTRQHKLPIFVHGIKKLEKKPKGTIVSMLEAWQNSKTASKRWIFKPIHQCPMGHLLRVLRRCELFQMLMKLFDAMIILRLQHRSRSFQRKPLQQQEEQDQQLSAQGMNLQGLVLHGFSQPSSMWEVHPQGMFHPPTATPMTPGYPPRPPTEALPKPAQEMASRATLKHPLPQPAQQGPPNKQVRHKAFPKEQQATLSTSMASPSAVDMSRMSAPSPKGPPAAFTPTPGDVQHVSSCAAAALPGNPNERHRFHTIRSPTDIDWSCPLKEQLEPNFKGGPDQSKPFEELCMLRRKIPKTNDDTFQQIYPKDNIICVIQKTSGRHYIHTREVAAWMLHGTHWFNLLKQPMMSVIWCRDWNDASKFQYLMQILQVNVGDDIPRYQIFVEREEVDKIVQYWQEPTTLWDGQTVIGFMAETYLDDLPTVGFKHFNPMWSFPITNSMLQADHRSSSCIP